MAAALTLLLDWRTYAFAALAGLVLSLGVLKLYADHEHKALVASQGVVQTLQASARFHAAQDAATAPVEAAHAAAQAQIQTVFRTLTQRVFVDVPPKADAGCVVPYPAVRLLNAGANGVPVLPDAASRPDGSPTTLSAVVANALANDQAAHANAAQLVGLQDWVRAQQAVHP